MHAHDSWCLLDRHLHLYRARGRNRRYKINIVSLQRLGDQTKLSNTSLASRRTAPRVIQVPWLAWDAERHEFEMVRSQPIIDACWHRRLVRQVCVLSTVNLSGANSLPGTLHTICNSSGGMEHLQGRLPQCSARRPADFHGHLHVHGE